MSQPDGKTLRDLIAADGRYPAAAVDFVREGLAFTVEQLRNSEGSREIRHVSGGQLSQGLRQFALKQWGLMAFWVLAKWRIHTTRDFGEIVYLMIRAGWMHQSDEDRIEDFDDVFAFRSALLDDVDIRDL